MQQIEFNKMKALLKKHKLSFCESMLCKTIDDAKKAAKKLGYPAVLKIASVDILHKSDIGGVKLNILNDAELENAFNEILKNAKKRKAKVQGIVVQKQKTGKEIIIGVKKDPQFGNVVMFGIGGIFAELFNDVSFRIAPIDKETAKEMIEEIKAYPLLKGARGEKPVSIALLIDMIVKTSNMVEKENKILELDFNPVIATQKNAEIVDARIITDEA